MSKHDLSKCICDNPGFCKVFNREMGLNPPDWEWCKKSSPNDRKSYFDLLAKAPPSDNMDTFSIINKAKTKEETFLYYLTLKNNEYICDIAQQNQIKTNKKIVEFIEKQKDECDFSNIEIACLGHDRTQFSSIEERPYLRKINLNTLDAGKYSGNEWAETRAFIAAKNLFCEDVDFIGFTTASWNDKYESFSRIDNFHNWNNAKILLNSKPEDKIVLCADICCACSWTRDKYQSSNILSTFFNKESCMIGKSLLKLAKLDNFKHIKVPFANQIIAHRLIIQRYIDYLQNENILDKVDWFVKKFAIKYIDKSSEIKIFYHNNRIQAYLMEMISCFWFANQDFVYIPNVTRKETWYSIDSINRRINDNMAKNLKNKLNKYDYYLKKALATEKEGNFDFSLVLYKECLKMNPNDEYLKQKISSFDKIKDYSICICSKPEFCLRYKTDMRSGLLDHNWCENASEKERKLFLQYKTKNVYIEKNLYEDRHYCVFAIKHQKMKDERFQEYLKNQQKSDIFDKLDKLTILSLGHSDQQFKTIKDKKYIKKVNLNKLDAGKYSTNDWSESRAFICKDKLFPDDSEFWGFTTASWNMKYDTNIDEFHNWENARVLLNSKPEDKIILCADTFCPCVWINGKASFHGHNVWSSIYKNNTVQIAKTFLKLIKLENKLHIHTPFSQQLIGHRDNLEKYLLYLKQEDVFAKIDWYVKKLGKSNFTKLFMMTKYNNTRLNGYFMEMTTCFWFANQDYYFLPTTKLHDSWYTEDKSKERLEWK